MSKCSIDDCFAEVSCLGVCSKHYMRMFRSGQIQRGTKKRGHVHERLHAHYEKGGENECWIWNGDRNPAGYGRISIGAKGQGCCLAHRIAWEAANGCEIPNGMVVMHLCDTPACVNPAHLRVATRTENHADMVVKKRGYGGFAIKPICGESHHDAKLTEDDVRFIRSSSESSRKLAAKFGLNYNSINKIRARTTWKHVL